MGSVKYQELAVQFLPADEVEFKAAVGRIDKAKGRELLLAHYDDFERFFDAVIAVKQRSNVHNAAIALRLMADLAMERLAQLEAESADKAR
jgi:ribosomal silencing factor RsfS